MLLALTSAGSRSAIDDSWRSTGLGGGHKPSSVSLGTDVVDRSHGGGVSNLGVVGELAETPVPLTKSRATQPRQ